MATTPPPDFLMQAVRGAVADLEARGQVVTVDAVYAVATGPTVPQLAEVMRWAFAVALDVERKPATEEERE